MTKLRLLNAYLTERLMVAVREILEVVEGTVSEFQEEAARTHRENESLRRRLREVGYDTEADWPGVTHEMSPAEQRHYEQEWSCSLKKDTELTVNEDKQVLSEQQRARHREELCCPNVVQQEEESGRKQCGRWTHVTA
ncbi:hypothetical protein MATL_G00215440 [Megalops atlanticus]|uniref:Uncharacterized protein n=1 Tax=Megalops atlanticus TaxID=7932 RepID=A0A9D3SX97_MEGAT|nr:hypothetical protein MATL_G00215440 [Megalops atlanticus]